MHEYEPEIELPLCVSESDIFSLPTSEFEVPVHVPLKLPDGVVGLSLPQPTALTHNNINAAIRRMLPPFFWTHAVCCQMYSLVGMTSAESHRMYLACPPA